MLFPVLQILISFRVFLFFSYSVHFISLYSVISVVSQYSIFVIWIAVLFLLYAIVPDILKSLQFDDIVLNLNDDEANQNACQIEHIISEDAFNKFTKYIEFNEKYSKNNEEYFKNLKDFMEK